MVWVVPKFQHAFLSSEWSAENRSSGSGKLSTTSRAHATNAEAVEDWYLKVAGKDFTRL